jgi:hypothetical protein
MYYNEFERKQKIEGEKKLAHIKSVILPLAVEVFKPLDGERFILSDGVSYSAQFKKARAAFSGLVDKSGLLKKYKSLRINATASHSTISINFDISLPNKADDCGVTSCTYYKDWLYVGEVDVFSIGREATGNFKYKLTQEEVKENLEAIERVKKITLKKLDSVAARIEKKRKEIEALQASVPLAFKEMVSKS